MMSMHAIVLSAFLLKQVGMEVPLRMVGQYVTGGLPPV